MVVALPYDNRVAVSVEEVLAVWTGRDDERLTSGRPRKGRQSKPVIHLSLITFLKIIIFERMFDFSVILCPYMVRI